MGSKYSKAESYRNATGRVADLKREAIAEIFRVFGPECEELQETQAYKQLHRAAETAAADLVTALGKMTETQLDAFEYLTRVSRIRLNAQ